jgi:glycosyltransferase involved in cell wall biosynthesis
VKILISAFSCVPGRGSEPGTGWNVALETARLGHEVVVLTQTEGKEAIERELAGGKLPQNLHFDIFMPVWLEKLRDAGLKIGLIKPTWGIVSLLWQFCAFSHVRHHYKEAAFDLIHHVTIAGIRHPTLLTQLGVPTVIGPLGGGERTPLRLRRSFPWRDWCKELLRDLHTVSLRIDPITRSAFRHAKVIFLRTEASLVAVPRSYRDKVHVDVGLGIAETGHSQLVRRIAGGPFKLLYVGHLYYWKGVHLAIRALAIARAQGADATLTIVGDGPARSSLERLTWKLGIAEHIAWCGEIARPELLPMYSRHHAFLYPSLHDAGGMVILEAWAQGLPVICLALGGPGALVDETCGRVVPVVKRNEEECLAGLAAEIVGLAEDEDLRLTLAGCAIRRCREYSWAKIVVALHSEIHRRLQLSEKVEGHRAEAKA